MLLAIDIGNSTVKFGIFEREKLIARFSLPTDQAKTIEGLKDSIAEHLTYSFSGVIISSVVPATNDAFQAFFEKHFQTKPVFVNHSFDLGLKIKYYPPENLGVDRLVAAFAAAEKYGKPCIIGDFGTATTIDLVNSAGDYLGGIITPGINTLSEALFLKISSLPRVEIAKPVSVIGDSTVKSIQAGIFFGYIGLVEGILQRMIQESGERPRIIATGGFARLIAESCALIEIVDENLMLDGLRMIYERVSHKKGHKDAK